MANRIITGLAWTGASLEWTRLRAGRKRPERLETRTLECALPAIAPGADWSHPEHGAALKKALHGPAGEVNLALPASCAMLRVVELPTPVEAELAGMVELQVDKYCPYPLEHTHYAHEVLLQHEHATHVLIVAVKKDLVRQVGEAMRALHILPHRLDVDLPAYWQLAHEHGTLSDHARQLVLFATEREYSLVVAHHGSPVLFRTLAQRPPDETEAFHADLLDDIRFSLTALEAEWPSLETIKTSLFFHGEEPPPAALCDTLGAWSTHGIETIPLRELPPLTEGIAMRGLLPERKTLNLALPEWGETERFRKAARKTATLGAFFGLLWLIGMASLIIFLRVKDAEFRELEAGREELLQKRAAAREVQEKVRSLREYSDRSRSALECLRELSILLPEGVDLIAMTYRKGRDIDLRGVAPTATPIHDFIAALEQAPLFERVTAENILSRSIRGQMRTEFSVKVQLPGGPTP